MLRVPFLLNVDRPSPAPAAMMGTNQIRNLRLHEGWQQKARSRTDMRVGRGLDADSPTGVSHWIRGRKTTGMP